MKRLSFVLAVVLSATWVCAAQAAVKSVVLVHGAFADGSGWKPVSDILERDGYTVYVVQQPETNFDADVAATRLVLDRAGPCVLVGHSYGGSVITEAGSHDGVKALVYVAAFQPAVGESAAQLEDRMPPAAGKSIVPAGGNFLQVNPTTFHEDFAADVSNALAHFMALSQVPIAIPAFAGKITVVSWEKKPSYAVIATQDRMIHPDNERYMSKRAKSDTIEVPSSHAAYVSHPKEVAALIEKAAKAAQ